MDIVNQIMQGNPLIRVLGNYRENHIGFVYAMSYSEAFVLTNDAWKERARGIPHNSFIVAAAFDPEKFMEAHITDQEVVLLRVLEPTRLPQDDDLIRTRIEQHQRRTESQRADLLDGYDPITHAELQWGGLKCRILGTFYMREGELYLGSDVENFVSSTHLRAYKPRGDSLSMIVNYIDPIRRRKAETDAQAMGFRSLPCPFDIGTVRYTSSDRLHRGGDETLVPVGIQPSDFLARRTAVFGMTRTGKSNTIKTTVAAVKLAAERDSVPIGQLIFDINGEYANANHQDDGSSIAEVFVEDTVRYRGIETSGFEDMRINFYTNVGEALVLIARLTENDPYRSQTDLEMFLSDSLEEPDRTDHSAHTRWEVKKALFQCILNAASYPAPNNFQVRFSASQGVRRQIRDFTNTDVTDPSNGLTLAEATEWFMNARNANLQLERQARGGGHAGEPYLRSSRNSDPWFDAAARAYANVLFRQNDSNTAIRGWRALSQYTTYHSPRRVGDVSSEIYSHLIQGRIVILDLSVGPETVRKIIGKRIAQNVFSRSMQTLIAGAMPPNIVIYIEEAHNLIGKNDELTDTWPRIAKEGAKARIALVYATQEPSSIHPNIMSNSENWFVTHLNNDDELKTLSKYYDFADFKSSLKTAQDVGFARIKSLSSPFVISTQINQFVPAQLREQLEAIRRAQ